MEDAFISALVTKLQPAFYIIGVLFVLFLIAFGGTILKIWLDSTKAKEQSIESSIESLRKTISDNTLMLARMEGKLEIYIEKHEKNYNDLGRKIRDLVV